MLEDSFTVQKSPPTSSRVHLEDTNDYTIKKSISPGIIGGRLTIRSINNIEN